MKNLVQILCLLIALSLLLPSTADGQEEGDNSIPLDHFYVKRQGIGLRRIFKNFRFGLSTGYGKTYFNHKLDGYGIYQVTGGAPAIFASSTATRYTNWITDAVVDSSVPDPGALVINPNTAKLGFKSKAYNIPLKLTVHYEFNRYRIGAGYSYEYMHIGEFHPTTLGDQINSFKLSDPGGLVRRYFGMAGVSFYRWNDYLLTADLNIGDFKPKSNFNNSVIAKGLYYNLGVTAERDLSEYFKIFVRPSFEIKSYNINIPESGKSVKHNVNAFYLNIGVSYAIPELRKCFHPECHIQINHAHGNKEYRSRRHPIFKKQNPGYGENDKELIKYKGKNKKKMNPY